MGGRRILNDDQLDEMAEMREGGASHVAIARHFAAAGIKISHQTIAWQCLRLGIFPPHHTIETVGRNGGGLGRAFTPEEDERLLALDAQGLSRHEIGRQLGRRANSIAGRL